MQQIQDPEGPSDPRGFSLEIRRVLLSDAPAHDGGLTTILSSSRTLPPRKYKTPTFKYNLTHGNNSSYTDYLCVFRNSETTRYFFSAAAIHK
jgi:hypothetical protein